MEKEGLKARLSKNAVANLVGRGWYVILWVITTPFVLEHLGDERFGVWSLLFLLSGYLTAFDLGLGATVVRFTAQHVATSDWQGLRRVLSEIGRLYLLIGAIWVVVLAMGLGWLVSSLRASAMHEPEIRFALALCGTVFAGANLVSTGTGVLNGLQRMELSNGILVLASIPQFLVLLLGLAHGYGLYAVAWSTVAQWLTTAALTWIALYRLVPQLGWLDIRPLGKGASWIGFSSTMQGSNLIVLGQQQIDKLLLTAWNGVRSVTQFELGYRLANGIQSLPILALSPLIPAFAEIHTRQDGASFRRTWRRTTQMVAPLALGLGVVAIPVAPLLIRAWVGGGYEGAEVLAQWVLGAFSINLLTGTSTAAARGAGRPDLEIVPGVISLGLHVLVSGLLIPAFGAQAAGFGMFVGFLSWTCLYVIAFRKWSGYGFAEFWHAVKGAVIATPLGLLVGMGLARVSPVPAASDRLGLLGASVLIALGASAAFIGAWWFSSRSGTSSTADRPAAGEKSPS